MEREPRKLRDISEHDGPVDLPYLQRRISAGGALKSAAKHLLDAVAPSPSAKYQHVPLSQLDALRQAVEDWCNVPPSVESAESVLQDYRVWALEIVERAKDERVSVNDLWGLISDLAQEPKETT